MSIKDVTKMGNPVLRKVAELVKLDEINTNEFKELLQDMFDTMKAETGIGIAAPQIDVSKQVALIEVNDDNPRYEEAESSKLYTIINPRITILDQETQGFWEGCLSVPGLRGFVERPKRIQVDFLNENAEEVSLVLDGFLSTVFQHEIDHLFGTLYIDQIEDLSKLSYMNEYERFHLES